MKNFLYELMQNRNDPVNKEMLKHGALEEKPCPNCWGLSGRVIQRTKGNYGLSTSTLD